jgi:hypothetical protein
MQLSKLEAARRQLETAIKLYFEYGDEVSIHLFGGPNIGDDRSS